MFGSIGYAEIIIFGVVAVVMFGRKLPEVARSVGNSYAQFRQGLSEIKSSIDNEELDNPSTTNLEYDRPYDDEVEPAGPKFVPPDDE